MPIFFNRYFVYSEVLIVVLPRQWLPSHGNYGIRGSCASCFSVYWTSTYDFYGIHWPWEMGGSCRWWGSLWIWSHVPRTLFQLHCHSVPVPCNLHWHGHWKESCRGNGFPFLHFKVQCCLVCWNVLLPQTEYVPKKMSASYRDITMVLWLSSWNKNNNHSIRNHSLDNTYTRGIK